MIRPSTAWCRRHEEDGSALILALVIVTAVGILMATALSFAGTTLGNTPALRSVRNQTYYGQGVVDAAINNIRNSSISGTTTTGQPLCSANNYTTYSAPTPALAAGTDAGADGSTQFRAKWCAKTGTNPPGVNAPIFAIQTLGTGNAPPSPNCNNPCPAGINQSTGTNNTLSIDGGILSAGRIWNKGSGGVNMQVQGSVLAVGPCQGTIHTTDPAGLQCSRAQPLNTDPGYAPSIAGKAALTAAVGNSGSGADPGVTCPNTGHHVAWFSPGYYSELPSTLLSESLDTNCNGSENVWWFKPGFYYFDFTNAVDGHDWNVNSVIGGTPVGGWNTQTNPTIPWGTACDSTPVGSGDSSPSQPGVQFIFGGNSTFNVGHQDHLELCGPDQAQSPGSTQSIAVYGLNGNANQSLFTGDPFTDETLTAKNPPTSASFSSPGNAQLIDGTVATAVIPNNVTDTLSYSAFEDLPAGLPPHTAGLLNQIPGGAHITGLKFKLSRVLVGSLSNETITAKTPNDTAGITVTVPTLCTPSCVINATLPTNIGQLWRELNAMTVTYSAKASGTATDTVDGLQALVSYTLPSEQSLAIGNKYFMDGSDPQTSVLMHGTYYTPSVGLDIEGKQNGGVIFSRGVVLWTLLVDSNPSFTQTAAPFQVPGSTSERLVQFIGQVSNDGGSTWTSVLQACVAYNDNNSSGSPGSALPGYTLTVKGWTVLRSSSTQAPTCA